MKTRRGDIASHVDLRASDENGNVTLGFAADTDQPLGARRTIHFRWEAEGLRCQI